MKSIVLLILVLGVTTTKEIDSCSFKGHRLYGKVQIVDVFPDLKVQVVNTFPDLKVKIVEHNPTQCGEWQMVESLPDLKIQFVTTFPDIKIQYVKSFPGLTDN